VWKIYLPSPSLWRIKLRAVHKHSLRDSITSITYFDLTLQRTHFSWTCSAGWTNTVTTWETIKFIVRRAQVFYPFTTCVNSLNDQTTHYLLFSNTGQPWDWFDFCDFFLGLVNYWKKCENLVPLRQMNWLYSSCEDLRKFVTLQRNWNLLFYVMGLSRQTLDK